MSPIARILNRTAAVLVAAVMVLGARPAAADIVISKLDIGLPNTVALKITGMFTGNEILRLKAAISEIEAGKRVIAVLDSPGGNVVQGEALGRFFYDARIPTLVMAGSTCASACTFAFLGGRDPVTGNPLRMLASGARLGFHNFSVPGGFPERAYTKAELEDISRESQQVVYRNLMHLLHVKAPLSIMKLNTGTKHTDVYMLSEGDALEHGIAVLDLESGKLIQPDNLEKRMRKE